MYLKRVSFCTQLLYLVAAFLFSCVENDKTQQRPNIIWINSDDLGTELGCYGNSDVTTPNIDQLASEGVRFTKAYANSPVCSSSRSSMITGMYPVSVNCQDHRTSNMTNLPDGIEPVTEYFRKAGYYVALGNSKDMSKGGKRDYNFLDKVKYDGTDWNKRTEGQPFFAQIHIKQPHRVFEKHINRIDPDKVKMPACYPDHPLLRADWALYLETIQHCDDYVGKIMKRLEEEEIADNTIVFFFGDHGRPHLRDKQFLYEGGIKIPMIVRWPENLKPNSKSDELVSLVDLAPTSLALAGIDVPAHLQGNIFLGENSKKNDYVYSFRQRAGDADDNIRSITDGRYKLLWNRMPEKPYMQLTSYKKAQYPAFTLYKVLHAKGELEAPFNQFMAKNRPEIELYDLDQDPQEFNNLADDIEFAEIKNKLFGNLSGNMPEWEKNMVPENEAGLKKGKEGSYNFYVSIMEKRGLDPNISDEDYLKWWEKELLD
ncbi:MAG: sulfatase [Cyclobacteriaceae bacterium]